MIPGADGNLDFTCRGTRALVYHLSTQMPFFLKDCLEGPLC